MLFFVNRPKFSKIKNKRIIVRAQTEIAKIQFIVDALKSFCTLILSLFLATATFLDLEVDKGVGIDVIVSQRIRILEEDGLHLELLFARGHPGLLVQLGLQSRDRV